MSDTRIDRVEATKRESVRIIAVNAADLLKLDQLKIVYQPLGNLKQPTGAKRTFRPKKIATAKKLYGAKSPVSARKFYLIPKSDSNQHERVDRSKGWDAITEWAPLYGPKGSSWTKIRLLSSAENLIVDPKDQLQLLRSSLIKQAESKSPSANRLSAKRSRKTGQPKKKKLKNL